VCKMPADKRAIACICMLELKWNKEWNPRPKRKARLGNPPSMRPKAQHPFVWLQPTHCQPIVSSRSQTNDSETSTNAEERTLPLVSVSEVMIHKTQAGLKATKVVNSTKVV